MGEGLAWFLIVSNPDAHKTLHSYPMPLFVVLGRVIEKQWRKRETKLRTDKKESAIVSGKRDLDSSASRNYKRQALSKQ